MIAKQPTLEGDYLPARMLNEFTYCPRLYYYEHVEGLFAHNQETVEGSLRHSGLDRREDGLAAAGAAGARPTGRCVPAA